MYIKVSLLNSTLQYSSGRVRGMGVSRPNTETSNAQRIQYASIIEDYSASISRAPVSKLTNI